MAMIDKPIICLCDEEPDYVVFTSEELSTYYKKFKVIYIRDIEVDPQIAEKVMGLVTSILPSAVEKARKWVPHMLNLKAMVCLAVGYEYAYEQLKEFDIPMANTPSVNTEPTADHGLALMLAAGCGLMSGLRAALFNEVPGLLPSNYRSAGVFGSVLGILGMGSVGFAIAKRARAFHMSILYHNRTRKSRSEESSVEATYYSSLDDMLPHCDYVVVACTLTRDTKGILGKKQFQLMKPTGVLVNIGRGKLVDTDALVEALVSGEIAQAALDVTDPEPLPPGHPLLKLDNVIITPHMAFMTTKALQGYLKIVNTNLEAAILEEKRMPNDIRN